MPTAQNLGRPVEILLVEDSASDAGLTKIALERAEVANNLNHVTDGVEAMAYLRKEGQYAEAPRTDVMLLDLKMPRKDGLEVLSELNADANLKTVPVIVLTTSDNDQDVITAYARNARAYVRKPVQFEDFVATMRALELFWLTHVTLPPCENQS